MRKAWERQLSERCCRGKKALTEAQAAQASLSLWQRTRGITQPYPCPHCRSWHVGRVRRPQRAARQQALEHADRVWQAQEAR